MTDKTPIPLNDLIATLEKDYGHHMKNSVSNIAAEVARSVKAELDEKEARIATLEAFVEKVMSNPMIAGMIDD